MKAEQIRAIIADDEPLARKFIRRLLAMDQQVEIVGECDNGRDVVELVRKTKPDVVFLDVQMPEMDGFAALEAIGVKRLPEIVFTTAYETHAIRAFELHALDYLLKPFDQARLKEALKRVKEQVRQRRDSVARAQIGALLEDLKSQARYLERLIIRGDGRIRFLKTEEIDWVEADDKYVHLHMGKDGHLLRQTLSGIETQLDPKRFQRIHRSSIVNLDRVREMQPMFAGEYVVILQDGTKLTLSRKYKEKVFAALGKKL